MPDRWVSLGYICLSLSLARRSMSGKIFLSYRREDEPGFALALFGRLEQSFPPERLFMDVEGGIAAGKDFDRVLEDQVSACDVMLVVIGSKWLTATDEMGRRRLDNPQDFVRIEVESALRLGKRVIPVLVHKTEMPRADPLPEPLKPLARKNAVRLTQERFKADAQGLIKEIEDALAEAEAARPRATNEAAAAEEQRAGGRKAKADEAARHLSAPLRLRAWTKNLPWHRRILLWVLAGLVVLVAAGWNSLPLFYRTAVAFGTVVTSVDTQIPLDPSLTSKVRETSRRLADGLRAELDNPGSLEPPSPWTLAQLTAASNGLIKINAEVVRSYFRNTLKIECNCWQETTGYPPHVAISGWVLFALAQLNSSATEAQVRFFLKEQKPDGWWSVFQAPDKKEFASTFGTAWALIGLQTQLRNKLIPQTMEEDVSNAIHKGSSWLINHRGDGSRWKDYPLNVAGETSDSLSGLVMHALHLTASDSITQLKKEWLDNLPYKWLDNPPYKGPPVGDKSQNLVWIALRIGDSASDNSVQITLPWMLIATADAYGAGNYRERTRALLWMERALDQNAVIHADTQVQNWWRAEFLLAFRYVAD